MDEFAELSPRDNDTFAFPALGIRMAWTERGTIVITYPKALDGRKRKGPGTRKGLVRHSRIERPRRDCED